jgi:hypothetical protein
MRAIAEVQGIDSVAGNRQISTKLAEEAELVKEESRWARLFAGRL